MYKWAVERTCILYKSPAFYLYGLGRKVLCKAYEICSMSTSFIRYFQGIILHLFIEEETSKYSSFNSYKIKIFCEFLKCTNILFYKNELFRYSKAGVAWLSSQLPIFNYVTFFEVHSFKVNLWSPSISATLRNKHVELFTTVNYH